METSERSLKWGPWRPEEDHEILDNPGGLTYKQLALKIGRTEAAVAKRLRDLRREASSNGAAAPEELSDTEPDAVKRPHPHREALRQIEAAAFAVSALLAAPGVVTGDREDGFCALKLLLDAWDLVRSLDP